MNFHVDYWNRLGWVDRFSRETFTHRQRRRAAEWGSGRIYTPGFVRNGEEWRRRSMQWLLGQGLSTRVLSGENAGETLRHEFVVLKTLKRSVAKQGMMYRAMLPFPQNTQAGAKKYSVVFWVSQQGSQKPLQAVGGYLAQNP